MNTPLKYENNSLYFDNLCLKELSKEIDTPFYLYSSNTLLENYTNFTNAAQEVHFKEPLICFALKANPNLVLLKELAKKGCGADIVSKGELHRAIEAGIHPDKIVFSGVGKTRSEIKDALDCSKEGIYAFNVESLEELEMINEEAHKLNKIARISFRLNPMVHAKTHKHISTGYKTHKFGILKEDILTAIADDKYWQHAKLVGLSMHIGSQLTCMKATKEALKVLGELAIQINKPLEFFDVGGGLGVNYEKATDFTGPSEYMNALKETLEESFISKWNHATPRMVFEPGRAICASSGALITEVIRTKKSAESNFIIVDGGMNDFVRTSLYEAFHEILPIEMKESNKIKVDVVGPICETADCFGSNRMLPEQKAGDLLLINDVGAYGFSMSSNYNMRETTKEFVVDSNGKVIKA